MFKEIEKFLLQNTDKLAFLDVERRFFAKLYRDSDLLTIPLFVEDVKPVVLKKKEGIELMRVLRAMAYMVGLDSNFRFNKDYIEIIQTYLHPLDRFLSDYAGDLYHQGRLKDSFIVLSCALQFFPDDSDFRYNRSMLAKELLEHALSDPLKKELYRFCKREFEIILKNDKNHALSLYQSAYFDMNESDLGTATQKFLQAKELLFSDSELSRDIEERLAYLNAAISLERVEELIEADRVQEALDRLEDAKSDNKVQAYRRHLLTGYCLRVLERYEEAIEEFEKAFLLHGEDSRLLSELGLCFMMVGDIEQSEQLYLSALELDPRSVEILCNLSMVNRYKGDQSAARSFVLEALTLDDKDEIAISIWEALKKSEEDEGDGS
ncbi:MAG: tetratricopeptide repeat protein [Filifactor alocis]|nr:tetratricopeptide repeat protein [Filifactor alocis]